MKPVRIILVVLMVGFATNAHADIASVQYVQSILSSLDIASHIQNTNNPHGVTAAQVGLGNVQNVDQTNAANITSGTLNVARLPVGTVASTVAAGNDDRFDTIPTSAPSGTPPTGRVFVWFDDTNN